MGEIVLIDDRCFDDVAPLLVRDGVEVVREPNPADAMGRRAQGPHVFAFGPSIPTEVVLTVAGRHAGPRNAFVLMAASPDATLFRAAMRAGVRDVVNRSDTALEVANAILAAYEGLERVTPVAVPSVKRPARAGQVVTVFGTKGGVGKTTLATNLAAAMATSGSGRTALVDLDMQFGDVAIMLQLSPKTTIFDAAQAGDRLDAEMLKGLLVPHGCGLSALLAPVSPEQAEAVTAAAVTRMLSMLRELADVVVVDTPAHMDDVVLAALRASDQILAVSTLDVPSVKNTKVSLQKLSQLGLSGRPTRVVLNRADSKVFLPSSEVEKALGLSVDVRIPSDRVVPRCVNKGVPVVLEEPRSSVGRAFLQLADAVKPKEAGSHVA